MKKALILLYSLFLLAPFLHGQEVTGAWSTSVLNDEGVEEEHILTFTDGFFSEAVFEKSNGTFVATNGGSFIKKSETIDFYYEYHTEDIRLIEMVLPIPYSIQGNQLTIRNTVWTRIDDGTPGELSGAWLITGRKRDGEIVKRDTSGPRKTMKILSGTRFQWIAYNTATKEFMGTGGGTYTTIDGKYTEHIGFFSRDDSRVGASLEFNYELKDGDWHHSGMSSKGTPIYEVWSKRAP